jgi:hypothetical protein
MKPAREIEIKDLLSDNSTYKAEWLRKGAELSKIRDPLIREKKIGLFNKMMLGIGELKKSSLTEEKIRIYKKNDYSFLPTDKISPKHDKKNPAVTSEKIEWKKEGSDGEMVFQVNFAHSEYGGATFGYGFVQEEIKNVLSTTASILTANKASLNLAPRDQEKPTPVVIVGQIKNFTGTHQLPYGWGGPEWEKPVDSMIKNCPLTTFNELAIAANELKTGYGSDDERSVKALFNNALAGFKLAKEVADAEGKSCKIKTGLFGAGAFHNSPEFSIAMQYLAARIAGVEIEFSVLDQTKHSHVEQIFKRVDEMISSEMSLDHIVKEELLKNWASVQLDVGTRTGGWRTGKNIPSLNGVIPKALSSKSAKNGLAPPILKPEEKKIVTRTWFKPNQEEAEKVYIANDTENLPIASPIYRIDEGEHGGKFKFAQKALGDGACYFNSAIIAILNDCVGNKENWNEFRKGLLAEGQKEIADKIGDEGAELTREDVNQLLQVRGDENIVKKLTLSLVVPHNSAFRDASLARVKSYFSSDLKINSDKEYLSFNKAEFPKRRFEDNAYEPYSKEVKQYREYESAVGISESYDEQDLEPIVKKLYKKKGFSIYTIDGKEGLKIFRDGSVNLEASTIYLYNNGAHFDVFYPDLDNKIEADLTPTKSSSEFELDDASETNEKKTSNSKSKLQEKAPDLDGKIEADLSSTKSSSESEVDDASETNEKKTSNSKSNLQEKAGAEGKSLINRFITYITSRPAKFETSETGKAWSEAKKDVLEAFDSTLPWGKAAKDENGNTIKWPLGFLNKMSLAVVDLALTIAWGVFQYILPRIIKNVLSLVIIIPQEEIRHEERFRAAESNSIEVKKPLLPAKVKIAERVGIGPSTIVSDPKGSKVDTSPKKSVASSRP